MTSDIKNLVNKVRMELYVKENTVYSDEHIFAEIKKRYENRGRSSDELARGA